MQFMPLSVLCNLENYHARYPLTAVEVVSRGLHDCGVEKGRQREPDQADDRRELQNSLVSLSPYT